jgi:hypothetical protein
MFSCTRLFTGYDFQAFVKSEPDGRDKALHPRQREETWQNEGKSELFDLREHYLAFPVYHHLVDAGSK